MCQPVHPANKQLRRRSNYSFDNVLFGQLEKLTLRLPACPISEIPPPVTGEQIILRRLAGWISLRERLRPVALKRNGAGMPEQDLSRTTGLVSWHFPATSSKAHSSLSPNQLHEGFNLLRNLSAVGAEILL